ncbi:MAG: ATP-grasp domain-containing protein [Bacteroidales bacterium]|nr:ATP-grasp domain-containing protein [Bacteroidales bacterium]
MKRKLAVIGASYLQLPLVQKAREMGIETHCFAWEEGAVCREYADFFYPVSIIEKEAILAKCREIGIDGICSIASDTAVVTVNYVATAMGLTGNDSAYSGLMTNKYRMRRCFEQHGLPSPHFCVSNGDVPAAVASFSWPLIVKPTDRSGSLGVTEVASPDILPEAIRRAVGYSFSKQAIVEEFVSGSEHSIETISWHGKHHILQMTDKTTTGAPYYVELAHQQPSTLPQEAKARLQAVVSDALDAMHIENGASHAECKITGDGEVRIIEIGARMGGDFIGADLVRLSTGYDFVQGVIEIALGYFQEPVLRHPFKHAGVWFLSEETAWLEKWMAHPERHPEIIRAVRTSSELRAIRSSADRSGYLIWQSDKPFIPVP